MSRLRQLVDRRILVLALKAGVAAGLAYYLGSLLPSPLEDYKYYAALGAFTVVGLLVVDSVKESLRVFAAVSIGVGAAVVVQLLSWTNPWTVAGTVLVCVLLGAFPSLGEQRSWAPLAALFVLATGGPDPEPMALGYLVQVPLGAAVGILVNLVLLAPLGTDDLGEVVVSVRELLVRQLRQYAELLEDAVDGSRDTEAVRARSVAFSDNIQELEQAQVHLLTLISDGWQAQRANPRARLRARRAALAQERAVAISRCASALVAAAVVLRQTEPAVDEGGRRVRRDSVELLRGAAELLDRPERQPGDGQLMSESKQRLDKVLQQVHSADPEDGADRVLLGALALSVWTCLEVFEREVADPPRAA